MNRNETITTVGKRYEPLDSTAAELELAIQRMSERENEQREEITKKYTTADEKESAEYERGFSEGYQVGLEDGWAKGFDEGLKQAKKEEESG
jgi:flagellar biosynthesis/type III secretory pathway protein FliH